MLTEQVPESVSALISTDAAQRTEQVRQLLLNFRGRLGPASPRTDREKQPISACKKVNSGVLLGYPGTRKRLAKLIIGTCNTRYKPSNFFARPGVLQDSVGGVAAFQVVGNNNSRTIGSLPLFVGAFATVCSSETQTDQLFDNVFVKPVRQSGCQCQR